MGQMELSGGRAVLRLRFRNLRVRPDRRRLPRRRRAGRDGRSSDPEGVTRERYAPHRASCAVRLRARLFLAPRFDRLRPPVQESREKLGRLLAAKSRADAELVVPVPDSGVAAAIGYSAESGIPFRQALIRNHYVGRTFIEPSQAIRDFGVKLKLNPVRASAEGQARGAGGRFHRPRHHQPQDRPHGPQAGAREVHLRISCPPTISPCFYGVDTPTKKRTDRRQQHGRGDPPIRRGRFARLSVASRCCVRPSATTRSTTIATPATPATIRPRSCNIEELRWPPRWYGPILSHDAVRSRCHPRCAVPHSRIRELAEIAMGDGGRATAVLRRVQSADACVHQASRHARDERRLHVLHRERGHAFAAHGRWPITTSACTASRSIPPPKSS